MNLFKRWKHQEKSGTGNEVPPEMPAKDRVEDKPPVVDEAELNEEPGESGKEEAGGAPVNGSGPGRGDGPGDSGGTGVDGGSGDGAGYGEGGNPDEQDESEEDEADKKSPRELEYLKKLIRYRLVLEFRPPSVVVEPPLPPCDTWDLPLGAFIRDYPRNNPESLGPDEARLLLIALVHHIQPDLFDQVIDSMLKGAGDFPKIGGVRGKDFRGFMPTGETALFLLAGYDWQKRLAIQRLFWADHPFARKRILWLEETASGEPVMSGKITLSRDYVDIFTHNTTAPPHFGMSFPAKLVIDHRKREDLVVSKELNAKLDSLLDWIKYNGGVAEKGGQDGRFKNGYRVLFHGPSGTGKTFAACILGNETGREVYRVDLAMVVSKFIGETEKNLELLFARAESKKWILFFDEADALFGKRTNVRDSHDKYANQEASYLLQRIEDYDGLVILATNMKNNIDDAFVRRFNSMLQFSMPDMEARKKIWEKTFPTGVKFEKILPGKEEGLATGKEEQKDEEQKKKDEEKKRLDTLETIKKYDLSGGSIANIVHYASIKAFKRQEEERTRRQAAQAAATVTAAGCASPGEAVIASEAGEEPEKEEPLIIYQPDVIEGIRQELSKSGIPFNFKR